MSLPVVALVGRPNVGKSSIFKRILYYHVEIVYNIEGNTRE